MGFRLYAKAKTSFSYCCCYLLRFVLVFFLHEHKHKPFYVSITKQSLRHSHCLMTLLTQHVSTYVFVAPDNFRDLQKGVSSIKICVNFSSFIMHLAHKKCIMLHLQWELYHRNCLCFFIRSTVSRESIILMTPTSGVTSYDPRIRLII